MDNSKNFFVMLPTIGWEGPTAKVQSGPDIKASTGQFIGGVSELYKITLVVDPRAENPLDLPLPDILRPNASLLFSQRFIDLLGSLGVDNIQYFDADVVHEISGKKLPYKVANVVGIVSGLDMDNSEVILSPRGNVMNIEKMCLDEDKLQGHKIFRLQERRPHLVVHKSIKEAVEREGLVGFMFVTDDEYDPSMI